MKANPLTVPIARLLREHPAGLSEYQLMTELESDGLLLDQEPGITPDLLLFRKHFLIMNALYRLQPVFWEQGCYLCISALNIELQEIAASADSTLPCSAGEQAVRDYYLDWQHFENSSSETVERLLDSFWQRYFAEDKKRDALAALQLPAGCSWSEIQTAYRRLAARHHPDRGGDSEQFRRVREAYEMLACCRG